MTNAELTAKIAAAAAKYANEWEYVGVRFEDCARIAGDVCNISRDNPDRDDERDFPAYGTDEYTDMPPLCGTSAWDAATNRYIRSYQQSWQDDIANVFVCANHCYIVGGMRMERGEDDNEIIISNDGDGAVVLDVIF